MNSRCFSWANWAGVGGEFIRMNFGCHGWANWAGVWGDFIDMNNRPASVRSAPTGVACDHLDLRSGVHTYEHLLTCRQKGRKITEELQLVRKPEHSLIAGFGTPRDGP